MSRVRTNVKKVEAQRVQFDTDFASPQGAENTRGGDKLQTVERTWPVRWQFARARHRRSLERVLDLVRPHSCGAQCRAVPHRELGLSILSEHKHAAFALPIEIHQTEHSVGVLAARAAHEAPQRRMRKIRHPVVGTRADRRARHEHHRRSRQTRLGKQLLQLGQRTRRSLIHFLRHGPHQVGAHLCPSIDEQPLGSSGPAVERRPQSCNVA